MWERVPAAALGNAAICSIALLLCVYEAWLFSRRRASREHLWLAVITLLNAIYAGTMLVHYSADASAAVFLSKVELAVIVIMIHSAPFAASALCDRPLPIPSWLVVASLVVWLAVTPTSWVIPDDVELYQFGLSSEPFPRRVETPGSLLGLAYAVALTIGSAWWLVRNRHGREREALHFGIGVAIWMVVGVLEVGLGLLDLTIPMSMFEYGFAGFALALVSNDARRYMEMLSASERDFRTLMDRSPDSVAILVDGVVTYGNDTFVETLGRSGKGDVEGEELLSLVVPDDRDAVERLLAGQESKLTSVRFQRQGGSVELDIAAFAIELDREAATVLIARDVSEERQLTARMMDMDRMISMGTLAAGIGHEINNPLSYVLLNLEQAARELGQADDDPDAGVRHNVEASLDGARRIRDIATGLARFSRQREEHEPLELEPIVRSATAIAANQVRMRARLTIDVEPGLIVLGNESRIAQVLVNLLVNAAHAIEAGAPEQNEVRIVGRRADDETVVCEVHDTGSGIDEESLESIFDPFFTTKKRGQGTGLGLTICRESVEEMGGTISVESTLGVGSRFSVRLPAHAGASPQPSVRSPTSRPPARRASVLLVDDEPMLLRSLRRALSRDADVVVASSLKSALEHLGEADGFDVIISDLMMPGGTGMDLYDHVRQENPDLAKRMLFITGGAFTPEARAFRTKVDNEFLEKPVDVKQVRAALRRATR